MNVHLTYKFLYRKNVLMIGGEGMTFTEFCWPRALDSRKTRLYITQSILYLQDIIIT